jgi:hypothetical protein
MELVENHCNCLPQHSAGTTSTSLSASGGMSAIVDGETDHEDADVNEKGGYEYAEESEAEEESDDDEDDDDADGCDDEDDDGEEVDQERVTHSRISRTRASQSCEQVEPATAAILSRAAASVPRSLVPVSPPDGAPTAVAQISSVSPPTFLTAAVPVAERTVCYFIYTLCFHLAFSLLFLLYPVSRSVCFAFLGSHHPPGSRLH